MNPNDPLGGLRAVKPVSPRRVIDTRPHEHMLALRVFVVEVDVLTSSPNDSRLRRYRSYALRQVSVIARHHQAVRDYLLTLMPRWSRVYAPISIVLVEPERPYMEAIVPGTAFVEEQPLQ